MRSIIEEPPGRLVGGYLSCVAKAKGDRWYAHQLAEKMATRPEVGMTLKAEVQPMGFGSNALGQYRVAQDFLEVLRARSLFERLSPRMRKGPVNAHFPVDPAGVPAEWISELGVKPVVASNFTSVVLGPLKVSCMVVFTVELLRHSEAEAIMTRMLTSGVARRLDGTFFSDVAAGDGPAGIAAGTALSPPTSYSSPPDLASDLASMVGALESFVDVVLVCHPRMLARLSAAGLVERDGGTRTVLEFETHSTPWMDEDVIVLVDLNAVAVATDADDEVRLDFSEFATVLMDDGESPAGEEVYSLFQRNAVAMRAERVVNWSLASPSSAVIARF